MDTARTDGRDTRWTTHRQQRRTELVQAAMRAIRSHGAAVGMDEIATEAGTSKTVIYRHFGDRLGLYIAVCEAVDALILGDFDKALATGPADLSTDDLYPVVVAVIDSYLRLVERDPEVYRFVIRRPLLDLPPAEDPVAGISDAIAGRLAEIIAAADPTAAHIDAGSAATVWAHGLVGFVRESADRWLSEPAATRMPRGVVVDLLARFAAAGLSGVLDLDAHQRTRR